MRKLIIGENILHEKLLASIKDFLSKDKLSINETSFKFKFKSPLQSQSQSQSVINTTICSENPCLSESANDRSQHGHNLDYLNRHFMAICIEYCVLKQVRDVEGVDSERVEQLVGIMREFYFNMCTEGEWKKEFTFEQNIIFVTKIVAEFYNTVFLNLSANAKLESEIYIILMHTLLGVKINSSCFQVLEKKHFRKSNNQDNSKEDKSKRDSYIKKEKMLSKRSTMLKKPIKNDRESMLLYYTSKRYSSNKMNMTNMTVMENDREAMEISPVEEFKKSIKESLKINPFPKIKKLKASIESFTPQNYHQINSNGPEDNGSKEYEKLARNSSFLSTEISSSLKSEIDKRNVSVSIQNHSFKIKHRLPYSSTHSFSIKNNSVSEYHDKIKNESSSLKEKNDSSKLNSQQWKATFKDLKTSYLQKEAIYTQDKKKKKEEKLFCYRTDLNDSKSETGIKSLMNSTVCYDFGIKEKEEEVKIRKERETCGFENRKKEKFAQREPSFIGEKMPFEFKLDCGTKDFKKIEVADFCIERPKKNKICSKLLRSEESKFDVLAQHRKEKINYSMFMLPSMRSKIVI